jgi:uncharacterized protein (DUF362 family)
MAKKSVVAVVKTTPETVLEDYARAMELAGYQKVLSPAHETALKINITWHHWYPACNTTPWQLEGVIRKLLADGFSRDKLHGCHNRTVVVSAKRGEVANKHKPVLDAYGLRNVHLYEGEEWTRYEPKARMRALNEIYPTGIEIPRRLIGENIIHLPTMKTHVFTTMTGAMKNAFGGLLHERRHWTHSVIHETLVDLLAIQKEIHPGVFAVMDGTFAGDGPGPRCMVPHVKNYILASADQVAIDAVAAKMMGFDPMGLKFIRLATEDGLGMGRFEEIDVVGEDISGVNWRFAGNENTFVSHGQKMIYWGPLKPLEKLLLRTAITPWSYAASIAYHDYYWYPTIGKARVREALRTPWGQLFSRYEDQLSERAAGRSGKAA